MKLEKFKPLAENESVNTLRNNRQLLYAVLVATALSNTACSEEDPDPPLRGAICVYALDQEDNPMTNCDFNYKVNQAILDEDKCYAEEYGTGKEGQYFYNPDFCKCDTNDPEACKEDPLLIYGTPGLYRITAECGKLTGRIDVDLSKGPNDSYESRLIGSFCTDEYQHIADPAHPTIKLNDHLGFSTDTWCANKLSKPQLVRTEVVDLALDCSGKSNCDPEDGRDLLVAHGTPGQYTDGQPKHLTFTARTDQLDDSDEETVFVTLKQKGGPIQQLAVPVTISSAVCGNGELESREECEVDNLKNLTCEGYGFSGGELECVDCKVSTENCTSQCGNNKLEPDEECDGNDFDGLTCDHYGFNGGALSCTDDCKISTESCPDS
jgi:hypothetical protein